MLTYELATARAWAEIDVDAVLYNYRNAMEELAPGVTHIAVLKANAYGLGAAPLAKILYGEGARVFAVACVPEAAEIGGALPPDAKILVMGETYPPEMECLLAGGFVPSILSEQAARLLSRKAEEMGVTAEVHCKVDTGLNRLGFSLNEAADAIARVARLPGLRLAGLFSHLQRRSPLHDQLQAERLLSLRDDLAARGVNVPMLHLLDSIGMWRYPERQFDAVRDGAFLFGHTPQDYPRQERLRFSLTLKARVARVFEAGVGECLGYDADHPLTRPTRVATLSIGYADGYPRTMSQKGEVELHGRRARVLGAVCMDLIMVDVTEIPGVTPGDAATLLGGAIGIHEYAAFAGGYCNELMAMLGRRLPRIYLKGGRAVEIASYMP